MSTLLPTGREHFTINLTWEICCPLGVVTMLPTWREHFVTHWAWAVCDPLGVDTCGPLGVATLLPTEREYFVAHRAWALCGSLKSYELHPSGYIDGQFITHQRRHTDGHTDGQSWRQCMGTIMDNFAHMAAGKDCLITFPSRFPYLALTCDMIETNVL